MILSGCLLATRIRPAKQTFTTPLRHLERYLRTCCAAPFSKSLKHTQPGLLSLQLSAFARFR